MSSNIWILKEIDLSDGEMTVISLWSDEDLAYKEKILYLEHLKSRGVSDKYMPVLCGPYLLNRPYLG